MRVCSIKMITLTASNIVAAVFIRRLYKVLDATSIKYEICFLNIILHIMFIQHDEY